MSLLEQQIEVLQRRAFREKTARQIAEEQLEQYSRDIYQANLDLSTSLQVAEARQGELEFLNALAEQIVIENSLVSLFENVLPLFAKFIDASTGVVLKSVSKELQSEAIAEYPSGTSFSLSSASMKQCIEQYSTNNESWQLSCYMDEEQGRDVTLLMVHLETIDVDSYHLCFGISQTQLCSAQESVLNTARDLLLSGVKRRQYQAKITRRNKQLQESIDNLERAQTQLIHSEKMASLGQLAAGVAHEINNPIGFIKANSDVLRLYTTDFENCIKKMHTQSEENNLSHEVFNSLVAEYELDYIIPDMHEIVEANQDGIGRIRSIVSSLSTFSHPGEQEREAICLSSCVERSLQLVANELKYKHVIANELPKELPLIRANHGQLQQVFVILIINAVHAMPDGGTLSFAHRADESSITLSIGDTGCGIKAQDMNKIFTPFFTTKPVGSGTGLGLSICHTILEGHEAKVKVESEVGIGTQFHLTFKTIGCVS